MAAKTWSSTSRDNGVDELLFRNDTVSLCLLVNRRHRTMRVIDFRAGPTSAKRNFVIATAQREGVEKVFTLVERDEVATWTRLGFTREGSISAFYKRSDAWILGAVVADVAPMRAAPADEDEDEDEESDTPTAPTPAALLAERTVAAAKKLVRGSVDAVVPATKLTRAREADAKKLVAAAQRSGRALTGFEPFGRDAERALYAATTRAGLDQLFALESQSCFGSTLIEPLVAPRTEPERLALVGALRALGDHLLQAGAASAFTFAPADDVRLASAYLSAGFKRTAVLAHHLVVGGERKDATVWSRKLAAADG